MYSSTKPCIGCYKEIDARARKCPNCLTVHPRTRDRFAQLSASAIVIVIIVGLGFGAMTLAKRPRTRIDNAVGVDELRIHETRVIVGQLQGHDNLYVTGKMKNNSSKTVTTVSFEVRCFSKGGDMIASWHGNWNGSVSPRAEIAFKVDNVGTNPKDEVSTHQVLINHAYCVVR